MHLKCQPWRDPPRALMFAPLAWLKLQFFCHAGDTEIGGFGISAKDDLLYLEDFITVRQQVSAVSVCFDDNAVADFFDARVDQGLSPDRFARVWCHTHPGASVTPSQTDEETFHRSFGRCDWSLMFILGRTGLTYARLAFLAGPGGQTLLPVEVDWSAWPAVLSAEAGSLQKQLELWRSEYAANIVIPSDQFVSQVVPSQDLPGVDRFEDDAVCWGDVPWWEREPWHAELDEFSYSLIERDGQHEHCDECLFE